MTNFNNFPELKKWCKSVSFDMNFNYSKEWKSKDTSRRVYGYVPIYIPREIFHAVNVLPLGLNGVGGEMQIIKGDAFYQSYICHYPRGIIELLLGSHLKHCSGFIFPSICDVIRNLSGMFRILTTDVYIKYLDFPQNFTSHIGGTYYRTELEEVIENLFQTNKVKLTAENLNNSIRLFNHNRQLIEEIYNFRQQHPSRLDMADFYCILRAGQVIDVETHNQILEQTIKFLNEIPDQFIDKIKVIVSGSFCEQPPLGLIKTIENAGCFIVDDDFMLGLRWIIGDVPDNTNDPVGYIINSYLTHSTFSSAVYEGDESKGLKLVELAKKRQVDGVIFCAPSFCDPALLDRPLMEKACTDAGINHINFQYHENLGQFGVIKEQAGTFSDSVKLWV